MFKAELKKSNSSWYLKVFISWIGVFVATFLTQVEVISSRAFDSGASQRKHATAITTDTVMNSLPNYFPKFGIQADSYWSSDFDEFVSGIVLFPTPTTQIEIIACGALVSSASYRWHVAAVASHAQVSCFKTISCIKTVVRIVVRIVVRTRFIWNAHFSHLWKSLYQGDVFFVQKISKNTSSHIFPEFCDLHHTKGTTC